MVMMTDYKTESKWKCFSFDYVIKENGKCCRSATVKLWLPLEGLLSTQDAIVAQGVLLRFFHA